MSDEQKQENLNYDKWTVSPDFQKFLITILASFVGCLVALCLYYASVGTPARCSCPMAQYGGPAYYEGIVTPDYPPRNREMKPPKKHFKHDPAPKAPEPPEPPRAPEEMRK